MYGTLLHIHPPHLKGVQYVLDPLEGKGYMNVVPPQGEGNRFVLDPLKDRGIDTVMYPTVVYFIIV